ncbi:MAG: hypothetical protein Q8M40_09900 [Legionella sp.]|nr:hypothetical protein [Legionella sp.]
MSQVLIKKLKANLLNHFQSKMQSLWIEHNDNQIKEDVKNQVFWAEKEWASKHETFSDDPNLETKTIHGVKVPAYLSMYIDESTIRSRVKQEYIKKFNEEQWNNSHSSEESLSEVFGNIIDELNPELVLESLFKRHPWLTEELKHLEYIDGEAGTINELLAYKFIYQLFNDVITNGPNKIKWSWDTTNKLRNNKNWCSFSPETLALKIDHFPVSDIVKLYSESSPLLLGAETNVKHLLDHNFTRLDMYRVLGKNFAEHCRPQWSNTIPQTHMAPL